MSSEPIRGQGVSAFWDSEAREYINEVRKTLQKHNYEGLAKVLKDALALIDADRANSAERTGNRLEEIKTRVIQSHGNWNGDKEFANSFLREAIKEIEDWQAELSPNEGGKSG